MPKSDRSDKTQMEINDTTQYNLIQNLKSNMNKKLQCIDIPHLYNKILMNEEYSYEMFLHILCITYVKCLDDNKIDIAAKLQNLLNIITKYEYGKNKYIRLYALTLCANL